VASTLIKHAAPEKATPFFTQHAASKAISLISQNVILIFSQNAILIISLFKKNFFQSDSQHLIVCLIIISTLSAREID
jgi:hypothetical protein